MNIGLDLDGVLTDIQGFNLRHAPRFFKCKFNRDVVNESCFDIRDIFLCSDNEYRMYWKRYLFVYAIFEPARKHARALTKKLLFEGNAIFIITKRVFTCQNDFLGTLMRLIVRNWLWRNGICYNDIVYCDIDSPDSKRIACIERSIDILIDDEEVNIINKAHNTKIVCFDASYNRNCEGENILRATGFSEVYSIIKAISQNDIDNRGRFGKTISKRVYKANTD